MLLLRLLGCQRWLKFDAGARVELAFVDGRSQVENLDGTIKQDLIVWAGDGARLRQTRVILDLPNACFTHRWQLDKFLTAVVIVAKEEVELHRSTLDDIWAQQVLADVWYLAFKAHQAQ